MATRKGKKISGGKYIARRKRKAYERSGQIIPVKVGQEKRKSIRTRGGRRKTFLLKGQFVNVEGKKLEIKKVIETPSHRFLARQNILTKGTIISTELGNVKITNRPGQEGMINGVLIKE